ncbi:MAG: N,N-dimethylformamidase beta subunit family domain-containing protein [Bacteroidota bacterium]
MKKPIWRSKWAGLALILISAALVIGGYLILEFYFLFKTSDEIFAFRHRYFSHLELQLGPYDHHRGDTLKIYLSAAPSKRVDLSIENLLSGEVLWEGSTKGSYQAVPDSVSIQGTHWQVTHQQPLDYEPGWYLLRAKAEGKERRSSFFVQPDSGEVQAKAAILFSTNTWNAYNYWGGQSIYTAQNYTPTVSFQRPQPLSDPFIENSYPHHQWYYQAANKDLPLVQMLDSLGLDCDYYSMAALEAGDPRLAEYAVLIMATHSEYWSENMLSHLNQLLDSGVSLVNLAGNVAAYRTFFDLEKQTMTIYRRVSELWQYADTMGLRPFGQQAGFLGFHTYAPYRVMDSSWLWEGAKVKIGDLVGQKSNTYDYTYMYSSWWENLLGLRKKGKLGAAAGLEIDVPYEGTPDNWQVVAKGLNPPVEGFGDVYPDPTLSWDIVAGPDLGYYYHPGGGLVLGVGSMAFTGALPHDHALRTLVANAVRRGIELRE